MSRVLAVLLAVLLLAGAPPPPQVRGQSGCIIVEGRGIGAVQIGMSISAALSVAGPPVRQQPSGSTVTYTVRAPWAQIVADYGFVQRVTTVAATCRTARGVGPGSTLAQARDAYRDVQVSSFAQAQGGDLLSYPYVGVAFLVRGDRVDGVEVFRAEGAPIVRPAPATVAPPPAPPRAPGAGVQPAGPAVPTPTTAPGAWSVRSTTARVDDETLVVSGAVENKGAALAASVEVRLFTPAGQSAGRGEGRVQPSPVQTGGTGSFEVRIAIEQLIRRYTVTIRSAGGPPATLAEATAEIRNVQQFASIAAKRLSAVIQTTGGTPAPNNLVAVVTNASALPVGSATVTVEVRATCRVAHLPDRMLVAAAGPPTPPPPTPLPTFRPLPSPTPQPPLPTQPPQTPQPTPQPSPSPAVPPGRTVEETWTGTAVVTQIGPRSSAQAPVQLTGGVCLFFTSWSATARISNVRIAE
jgi:hypothetical protein